MDDNDKSKIVYLHPESEGKRQTEDNMTPEGRYLHEAIEEAKDNLEPIKQEISTSKQGQSSTEVENPKKGGTADSQNVS